LKTGRPVLIVPPGVETLKADRAVIGWKDTREARRAVRDAVPLLKKAQSVLVAEICETDVREFGERRIGDVVSYLARHGVVARPAIKTHPEHPIAAELIRLAQNEGADLIVAGAYGHSRVEERFFGGVTHALLASSPICCLLAN
jgi:nucleotide-binding universal stress UspA family protein